MIGYPVPGADEAIEPGRRRYNVVWYRPADEAVGLPRLLTGRDGRSHDVSIPPGQVAHEAVAELYDDADALLAPCCAEVVRLSHEPFIQAIYDFASPRLVFGRVILIGDAAFLARPHAGMGATKAARDALTPGAGTGRRRPRRGPAGLGAPAAALRAGGGRARALAGRPPERAGARARGMVRDDQGAGRHSDGRDHDLGLAARVAAIARICDVTRSGARLGRRAWSDHA